MVEFRCIGHDSRHVCRSLCWRREGGFFVLGVCGAGRDRRGGCAAALFFLGAVKCFLFGRFLTHQGIIFTLYIGVF